MSCRSIRERSAPTRASSTSAATRCPTWRCRFGSNGRSADCRSTGSGGRWPTWNSISPPARRSWPWLGATLETSVALRAAAIVLIVGSHATLYEMWGGAHLLLGIAGYNFGRFCLTPVPRGDRVRHLRKTIAWIVVPSVIWIALALLITDDYHPTNLLLVEKFFGPDDSMTAGRLWFVEVLVWILVALTFVCWLPAADRLERRRPFAFAAGFLARRAGNALRPVGTGLRPRGMVHDPGLLVLRGGLGRGQVVDGVAADRGDAGVDRQPARLLRQHRIEKCWCWPGSCC